MIIKHTLYGKMMINLLENYIFNDYNIKCLKETLLNKKFSLNTLLNNSTIDKCLEGEKFRSYIFWYGRFFNYRKVK